MCSYESDVHNSCNKYNDCNEAKIVATDIEHIATIFHVIGRRESGFKISMASPLGCLNFLNPLIKRFNGLSMRLHIVV